MPTTYYDVDGVPINTFYIDCISEVVRVGMPVEVKFVDVNDNIAVPIFKLA